MVQKEVYDKAAEVSHISLDYHFTHAAFACNKLLEDDFKKKHKKATSRLKAELDAACRKQDNNRVSELLKKIAAVKLPKYRIFVDYLDLSDPEGARVVKAEDKLIINLPKSLAEESRDAGGYYNKAAVQKLRRIMAHELGHIVLHTEVLLSINSKQGSKEIGGDLECEANWFADELIRLRVERNNILNEAL